MIRYISIFVIAAVASLLIACETVINPDLENAEPVLVVDAWLNTRPVRQEIKLTRTQPYFENSAIPGVSGATVELVNVDQARTFSFVESEQGKYFWNPIDGNDSLGVPGNKFSLSIQVGSEKYIAESVVGRAPQIDSITFTFEKASGFFPDYYLGEFWATDPAGTGDTYWIKAWKNDTLLLKPAEINIAYDAGFTEGSSLDGVTFIAPIRQAISPFDTDEDDNLISPYKLGDSVYVEIHSINKAAFNFLFEVSIQTDRPGGFAELFASPFANVSSNIYNTNPAGKKAVGFFNVGSVTGKGKRLVD
jgi:hypothetical protein